MAHLKKQHCAGLGNCEPTLIRLGQYFQVNYDKQRSHLCVEFLNQEQQKRKKRTKNQLLKAEAMKENKMFEKAGFQKCPNGKILQNA